MNALLFAITAIAFLVMWTILLRPRADRRCEHCSRPLEIWPEPHHGHRLLVCRHCRKAWGWGVSLRPSLAVCPRCRNQSLEITGTPDPEDEQGIHIVESCHLCGYSHEGNLHLRSAKAAREDGNVIFFPGADDAEVEVVPPAESDAEPDSEDAHEGEAIPFPGPAEQDERPGPHPVPDEPAEEGDEAPEEQDPKPPEPPSEDDESPKQD